MKKLICALFGVFISVSAFAAGGVTYGDNEYQPASKEMFIHRHWIENLRKSMYPSEGTLEDDVVDAMLAKYDELAASEDIVMKDSFGNFYTILNGTEKLTYEDLNAICRAGGLNTREKCRTYFINPMYTLLSRISYHNVCMGGISGGTPHCVDDVFTKEYEYENVKVGEWHNAREEVANGIEPMINFHSSGLVIDGDRYRYDITTTVTKKSHKSYAQDIDVSPSVAFGFAIEYARRNGHDVICSSNIEHDWINCTSFDNKHFYTFKFKGTNSTSDGGFLNTEGLGGNDIVDGICALFGAHSLKWYEIGVHPGCEMDCSEGTYASGVISRFGLTSYQSVSDQCIIYTREAGNGPFGKVTREYPGYEYMTYAFQEVQVLNDPSVRKALKAYVELQGIEVDSFECDYAPWRYQKQVQSGAYASMPMGLDDALRCKVNGIDVDFIFDDLFESSEKAREIGKSGMKCMMMKREYGGGTASFDGKNCVGPNEKQCTELGEKITGGTRFDTDTGLCIMNDAAAAKRLQKGITIGLGTLVVVGLTILSDGSFGVVLLEVAGGVALDATTEFLEQLDEQVEHKAVKDVIEKMGNCKISRDQTPQQCTTEQNKCTREVMADSMALALYFYDQVGDADLKLLDEAETSVDSCATADVIKGAFEDIPESVSRIEKAHNWIRAGILVVAIVGVFISPRNALNRVKGFKNVTRVFTRAGATMVPADSVPLLKLAKNSSKTAHVQRIDISTVRGWENQKANLLKTFDKRRIQYIDYSGLPEFKSVDQLKNYLSPKQFEVLKGDPAKAESYLSSLNTKLNEYRNYIDFSDSWSGRLSAVEVDIQGVDGIRLTQEASDALWKMKLKDAGVTALVLGVADEVNFLFGASSNEKDCKESGGTWVEGKTLGITSSGYCNCNPYNHKLPVKITKGYKCVDNPKYIQVMNNCNDTKDDDGKGWIDATPTSEAACDCGSTKSLNQATGNCEYDEEKVRKSNCERLDENNSDDLAAGKWDSTNKKCICPKLDSGTLNVTVTKEDESTGDCVLDKEKTEEARKEVRNQAAADDAKKKKAEENKKKAEDIRKRRQTW